jgi:acetoin utilization protein AcuB
MLVRERMTADPVVIQANVSVTDALALMREKKVRRLPVLDANGKLEGIVSEKDIIYASPSPSTTLNVWESRSLLDKLKVERVMTRNPVVVSGDMPLEEAARIMADRKIGGLPVMNGDRLVGIVTETDLFRAFVNLLGGYRQGVRVTATTSGAKGTVARIAQAIFAVGGDIVGLGFSEAGGDWKIALKVQGVSKDKLVEAMKPTVISVDDVRGE